MLMLLFYHDIREKVGQHREPDFLAAYKNQQKVERGFRFFKDPLFMALMMVMTLCLLVYAALEYRIFPKPKRKAQFYSYCSLDIPILFRDSPPYYQGNTTTRPQ
jgi:hypothetical protein